MLHMHACTPKPERGHENTHKHTHDSELLHIRSPTVLSQHEAANREKQGEDGKLQQMLKVGAR